jgi:hypothetical protein
MSTATHLSDKHRHQLVVESDIAPDIVAERGYRTVRGRAELQEFEEYQRRSGLLIPVRSPSGATGRRLRPDRPRKGKDGKPRRYEQAAGTPNMLDVHPRSVEALGDADVDLWVTEGEKKADSLTSRGLCSVALFGVWGWCVTSTKGRELLPCWGHIVLKGRRVYVVFDSDVTEKENVQLALERLVAALEARGAEVLVVYLPGPEKGVDDFFVAGGTPNELKMLARRFDPTHIGHVRLSRDAKLRALVEDLERRHADTRWTWPGADADEDVFLKLIESARRHGQIVADGLRVEKAQGPLALEAKVSSRTLWKSLNRLEERDSLYRDNKSRKLDKTGAFVLRASVSHKGGSSATEGKVAQELRGGDPGDLHPRAPRLWASRPKWKPTKKMLREHRQGVRTWMPEPREGLKRLGKKRGHCFDRIDVAGGKLTLEELGEQMGIRPRDLVRRKTTDKGRDGLLIWPQEAGIVVIDGDTVSLAPDWRARLEEQRELGEEIEAEEVARRRYRNKSRAYHNRNKALESRPSAAGLEAVHRSHVMRDARLQEIARAEEERCQAGPPPALEALISGILGQLDRSRMGLLCEVAREEGFNWRDVSEAVRRMGCRVEKLPEYGDGEFVYYGEAPPPPEPDREEWRDHSLDCECAQCLIPEPRYARGVA